MQVVEIRVMGNLILLIEGVSGVVLAAYGSISLAGDTAVTG